MKVVSKKANMFEIHDKSIVYLQSYDVIVAIRSSGCVVCLDEKNWDFSKTTMRHISLFLGEPAAEIRKKIKIGEYELKNLNP